jgi:hypothetical protein
MMPPWEIEKQLRGKKPTENQLTENPRERACR